MIVPRPMAACTLQHLLHRIGALIDLRRTVQHFVQRFTATCACVVNLQEHAIG